MLAVGAEEAEGKGRRGDKSPRTSRIAIWIAALADARAPAFRTDAGSKAAEEIRSAVGAAVRQAEAAAGLEDLLDRILPHLNELEDGKNKRGARPLARRNDGAQDGGFVPPYSVESLTF
uniref:Uncharacterized protein n=1 Tax=Trieres chinensis TaxID=1514140 RepID=A0A7S1ZF56_TRICV